MAHQDTRPEGTDTIIDDGTTAMIENEPVLGSPVETSPPPRAGVLEDGQAQGSGSRSEGPTTGTAAEPRSTFDQLKEAAFSQSADLRAQAADRARDYVGQGKDKATDALESLARMVSDAAQQVEDKVGPDYAVYARRAADAVTGIADGLKAKDVDALFEDAKGYIRSSPAVAIGAAAALGFVVARLAKAGLPGETPTEPAAPETRDGGAA